MGVTGGRSRRDLGATGYYVGDRLVAVSGMPGDWRGRINLLVFALTQEGFLARQYVRGEGRTH